MSVDLPAPFSPTTASTSPACRRSDTPSRAWTPGKDLRIASTSRRGERLVTVGTVSSFAKQFLQVLMERLHVVLLDYQMRNVLDAVQGQAGAVALGQGGQQLDGLVAELERLLHHCAVDVAF